MENPQYWTPVEHTISIALYEADMAQAEGRIGFSTPMQISNALKRQGLLDPSGVALATWLDSYKCNHPKRVKSCCTECDARVVQPLRKLLEDAQPKPEGRFPDRRRKEVVE